MMIPNKKKTIRGCIDLGSSYFRLLVVGHGPSGEAELLCDDKEYVGWGGSVAEGGAIEESGIARAAHSLERLLRVAERSGCEHPILAATNTMRSAVNGDAAHSSLERLTGRPITLLSQRGEAALGFLGASTVVGGDEPVLLVDVGGTSTEIAWGSGGIMDGFEGLPLGTHIAGAMMSRGYRNTFPVPCYSAVRRLEDSIALHYTLPNKGQRPTILATGGTAVSLAVILCYMKEREPGFTERTAVPAGMLEFVVRRMRGLFYAGLERRIPLEPERVRLLLPGLVLMTSLLRTMRVSGFLITARDLRWGAVTAEESLMKYSITGDYIDE
jgi:exopolyphosphatase/guanosine-5'-triphosphate,3'-diphosphate pyrophosphatase